MDYSFFLDLDGVICNLLGGIEIKMGIKLDRSKGSINFMKQGISKEEFWNSMSVEDWATLPKTEDADEILRLVEKYKPVILSANTEYGTANCIAGKLEWLKRNVPDYYREDRWFFGKKKYKLAHPNAVLIDDYEYNTDSWTKMGGISILVPRPWNKYGKLGLDTKIYIANQLRLLELL
jgi:hypothetical protein